MLPLKYTFNILSLLKVVGSARLRDSDIQPISSKTPAPQYQPIDRKKRTGKIVEYYSWDRAAWANKKSLTLLLKPASHTPSYTGSARSFQRDNEKEQKSCGTARFCSEAAHKYTDVRSPRAPHVASIFTYGPGRASLSRCIGLHRVHCYRRHQQNP